MAKKKGASTDKAKAKEAKKAKAEKKAEKRETKKTKGAPARGGADDDEDLDAILEKVKQTLSELLATSQLSILKHSACQRMGGKAQSQRRDGRRSSYKASQCDLDAMSKWKPPLVDIIQSRCDLISHSHLS